MLLRLWWMYFPFILRAKWTIWKENSRWDNLAVRVAEWVRREVSAGRRELSFSTPTPNCHVPLGTSLTISDLSSLNEICIMWSAAQWNPWVGIGVTVSYLYILYSSCIKKYRYFIKVAINSEDLGESYYYVSIAPLLRGSMSIWKQCHFSESKQSCDRVSTPRQMVNSQENGKAFMLYGSEH